MDRLLIGAIAVVLVVLGLHAWNGHLIAKGDAQGAARVQAAWDRQAAADTAASLVAADARNRQMALDFQNAERIARDESAREDRRKASAAAAAAADRSLRADLDRLAARPQPYAAGEAGLAACAGEATVARQLFGESAGRYREVAAEADQLRDQVIGLQDFATTTCRAGTAGDNTPTPTEAPAAPAE